MRGLTVATGVLSMNLNQPSVTMYTRVGCHLCDEALAILRAHQLEPKIVDIDQAEDANLLSEFNECVPVVKIDGKIRFRGRVNETLLRRLLS